MGIASALVSLFCGIYSPFHYTFGTSTRFLQVVATLYSLVLTLVVYPSDMAAGLIGDGVLPKSKVPLERAGTEEDMAGATLFLTSRAGAYITGNILVSDGGRLSILPSAY